MAALSYLTNTSSVRTRVDRNRLAVMGHSMGGGGTMEAATENPSLQAAIPLTGWHTTKNFSGNRVPTLEDGTPDLLAPYAYYTPWRYYYDPTLGGWRRRGHHLGHPSHWGGRHHGAKHHGGRRHGGGHRR